MFEGTDRAKRCIRNVGDVGVLPAQHDLFDSLRPKLKSETSKLTDIHYFCAQMMLCSQPVQGITCLLPVLVESIFDFDGEGVPFGVLTRTQVRLDIGDFLLQTGNVFLCSANRVARDK